MGERVYAGAAAVLGWSAVVGQYWIGHAHSLASTVNYFSFFTILSNILVAAILTSAALALPGPLARGLLKPAAATAAALYIVVTGLVYFFLLRHLYDLKGWVYVWDVVFHYVIPPAFALFWLVFVPKGALRLATVPSLLIFPLAYAAWTLLQGAVSGFYPYPFVDVTKLGYAEVFLNMAGFVVFFALMGCLLVLVDRLIGRLRAPIAAPS